MDDDGRALDEFLAGDRPDEVALFLADDELDDGALADRGTRADGGVVLVVPGERGRRAFAAGTGMDAMAFAREATNAEGRIAERLDGGECPDDDGEDGDHAPRFVFSFVEEQNEAVGGRYAEGDVVHAYARCTCGTAYSDRWVAGER